MSTVGMTLVFTSVARASMREVLFFTARKRHQDAGLDHDRSRRYTDKNR